MPKFIHSVIQPRGTVAADGVVLYDLPVNPLSAIILNLIPLNDTTTITNYGEIARILSAIDNVSVLHRGSQVFSMNGPDLFMLNQLWQRIGISQSNSVNTDNDRRSLAIAIPLSRYMYDPMECFPASKRGDLQLSATWDIADTGYDALQVSIETIELPDAKPTYVQKVTTLSQTFAAVGQNDISLPIGNVLRGLIAFGTTGWTGPTPAPTLGQMSILANNLQTYFSATDFATSRLLHALTGGAQTPWDEHVHGGNFTSTVQGQTQFPNTLFPMFENYTALFLDVLRDDTYSLDTAGLSALVLRCVAEAANAARICPIEKVPVEAYLNP